jgi:tetratricopeptide (TPR) repeat protein
MFSKTAVVTLPAVLLVLGWWKRGRITRYDVECMIPFFMIGAALSAVTVYQEKYHCGARGADFAWSWSERFLMAGQALWFYAKKLVWPHPIVFFYPRFSQGAVQYLYPLAALAVPIALWLLRPGRGPLAAVLIFAGVLMPALGFFNVYYFLFAPVADHFQYHACPALIALLAASAVTLWTRIVSAAGILPGAAASAARKALTAMGQAGVAALLTLLAVRSYRACMVLESEEAIYRDVISKNPASWIAYTQLGVQLAVRQEYDEALAMGRKALELAPEKGRVHHNYATTILEQGEHETLAAGELDEAIGHFERAIEISPELAAHYVGLGRALMQARRYPEASTVLLRAAEIEPQNGPAWWYLGKTQQQLGDEQSSFRSVKRAMELTPHRP